VQDGTVIHAGPGFPTTVGDGCVIGHLAHLEGCQLEDECLVGSGSVVLHHAVVGTRATVGANAVVPNGMAVPEGALAVGVPAEVRPGASRWEIIPVAAAEYVANGRRFRDALVRIDRPD
jgi:carbonic anhydrase/acetyltransferase-like protein (isoleucine patch superfamily)